MKRKIMGLAVIALAISLSAFEARPAQKKFTTMFWFLLAPGSGFPYAASKLIYQASDPWACEPWGFGDYCAGGYTSYSGTGPYFAAGSELEIDYELTD